MQESLASPSAAGWRIWLLASRPATLPGMFTPVLVGTAAGVAARGDDLRLGAFLAAMAAAMLIQIGTNFANDLSDFASGADHAGRLGPVRATHSGVVTPAQMRTAAMIVLGLAAVIGVYLIVVAGWPVLVVGVAALVAAVAYTGGPWPYGYHSLGDPLVFFFFGIVGVMGSYYMQLEQLSWTAAAAAVPLACTVTAILVVNNLRDIDSDRQAGKRTLAVSLGDRATRAEYALLMAAPFVLAVIFKTTDLYPWWSLQTLLALPPAIYLVRRVLTGATGVTLNPLLQMTGQTHLLYGVLLAGAFLWG